MSKKTTFIIEEVDSNDVPEEYLKEFVEAEEIPIDSIKLKEELTDEELFSEGDSDAELSDEGEQPKPSTSTARPAKKRKKTSPASGKQQSLLLKKLMSSEITYNEYVKRMGTMDDDDG